ncbi:MAG: hypothetical protein AAF226_09710, partial [Verrucomicrobiota bacterium]
LDGESERVVLQIMKHLHQDKGMTILHGMNRFPAWRVFEGKVAVMLEGYRLEVGEKQCLIDSPEYSYTAQFINSSLRLWTDKSKPVTPPGVSERAEALEALESKEDLTNTEDV